MSQQPPTPQGSDPMTSAGPAGGDPTTRRLLYFLVGLLAIAALALLVVLFYLLRPEPGTTSTAAEGYPIIPVRSLVAYGGDIQNLLSKPLSATFDSEGNVWVSDTGNNRVVVFGSDGSSVRTVGDRPGPGKLIAPYGIAVDEADDKVYVADYGNGRIQVYTTEGIPVTTIPNAKVNLKQFGTDGFYPYDVKVLNDRIVASSNNGIYFFSKGGDVIGKWGTSERGIGYTQFNFPDAFAVDCARDRIYVTDSTNRRVTALDSSGRVLWMSGSPDEGGQMTGFWQLPKGITIGPDGNLYIVDTFRTVEEGVGDGYVVVLSPEGDLVSAFGRTGDSEDSLSFPEHIAYNGNGLWAIADREHNRVLLFRLDPIPPPDEANLQKYPGSLDLGPFPELTVRAEGDKEKASPSPAPSLDFSCPVIVAAVAGGIPWWVWLLLAIALILILAAIRRLWKNRKAAQAAALAASATTATASTSPAPPVGEAPGAPSDTPGGQTPGDGEPGGEPERPAPPDGGPPQG